jgi:hypothetical protein
MPEIGRWGVVDPLTVLYPSHSQFNYAVNNPIKFVDVNGLGPGDPTLVQVFPRN